MWWPWSTYETRWCCTSDLMSSIHYLPNCLVCCGTEFWSPSTEAAFSSITRALSVWRNVGLDSSSSESPLLSNSSLETLIKFHIQTTLSAKILHVCKVPLVSRLDHWQGDNILFAFHKIKIRFSYCWNLRLEDLHEFVTYFSCLQNVLV